MFKWEPWMGYALVLAGLLVVVLAVLYAGRLRSYNDYVRRKRPDLALDAPAPLPAPLDGPAGRCTFVESRYRGRLFLVGESVTADGHRSLREITYHVVITQRPVGVEWCARPEGVALAPYRGTAESTARAIDDARDVLKEALGAVDDCELDGGRF